MQPEVEGRSTDDDMGFDPPELVGSVAVASAFTPILPVAELADVVIRHGGKATIQTALARATPILGMAMQMEQQINLDNLSRLGAGIRIPPTSGGPPTSRR